MKKLIIMRGLPGSGKSTLASEIAREARASGLSVEIRSTDDQFVVFGVYRFDPSKIGVAHLTNHTLVEKDMLVGVNVIIVDNTSVQLWESRGYRRLAVRYGYEVETRVVGDRSPESVALYAQRNTHNVPLEVIQRMASKWQD